MLSCEGKVTREECLKALNEFKTEKSPSTGGLQAEFYKHFWKELHADMLHSFNYAYDSGKLRGSSLHLFLHSAVQIYEFQIFIISPSSFPGILRTNLMTSSQLAC